MFKLQIVAAGILMAGAAFTFSACKSAVEKQFEAEQIVISPPLDHDPTNRDPLSQWWANDTLLLRLDENAAYSLYAGANRYLPPIEHGRWSQQSYAVLWLEPYNTIKVDPRRVSISKVGSRLALTLPSSASPLLALDRPPIVLEDRIVGTWEGELGTLQLMENLRYTLAPRPGDTTVSSPQRNAMRKGNWKIAENQLVLLSDVPGVEPLRLPLTATAASITIAAPEGTLSKVAPQRNATAADTPAK